MSDTRRAVLEALSEGPVPGPDLAERLGVSRTAVWNYVEELRAAGFGVESTDAGYRVTEVPDYGGLAVEYGLDAPFRVEYHDSLPSTNDRARELATEGERDVAVLADEQTGGRGRLDREWASPPGGVWLSVVLDADLPPARAPLLTLAGAVAVARAAREAGVDARIKWPNDVLVPVNSEERKLAGVLTEMEGEADRVRWVVLGMGVNADVDADTLPPEATSLRALAGEVDRRVFVQRVLEILDALRSDPDAILPAWRELAATLGRRVRVETPAGTVEGEATDVTETGALVVETDEGTEAVHAGDCEHLRAV
jgi:BirA family biotin operon repressor/biotin-[acetyl-CoA-carboxylase] ligase